MNDKGTKIHISIENTGHDTVVIYYQNPSAMSAINFFAPILIVGPQGPKGEFGSPGFPGENGKNGSLIGL